MGNHIYLYILVGVAVIAGVGVGVYKVFKSDASDDSNSYEFLIKNQYVCDELNLNEIKKWFLLKRSLVKGNAFFFLAKPSPETSAMFALNRTPRDLDVDHSVLQIVVDDSTNLPVDMRLISFSRLSSDIESSFKDKKYIVVNIKEN